MCHCPPHDSPRSFGPGSASVKLRRARGKQGHAPTLRHQRYVRQHLEPAARCKDGPPHTRAPLAPSAGGSRREPHGAARPRPVAPAQAAHLEALGAPCWNPPQIGVSGHGAQELISVLSSSDDLGRPLHLTGEETEAQRQDRMSRLMIRPVPTPRVLEPTPHRLPGGHF